MFHIDPVKTDHFDSEYNTNISWGTNVLDGYDSGRFSSAHHLLRAATQWGADVVLIYGYTWPGILKIILRNWLNRQAQIHRGPLTYHLDPRRRLQGRLFRPFRSLILRRFHAHHYGGKHSLKVLRDASVREEALFKVPYSVDTPYFRSAAERPDIKRAAHDCRTSLGWTPDHHVILLICQHNWVKGPDIAMQAFRSLAKIDARARFLILGSGRMTPWMKAYAAKYLPPGLVHFAGFIPSAETVPYYLASDLVICTSRYETWGRMINEAMLCRRPCVINHKVPAGGDLVKDSTNGLVVQSHEPEEYVSAIRSYFSLPESRRREMANRAMRSAQSLAYEGFMDQVYNSTEYARRSVQHSG